MYPLSSSSLLDAVTETPVDGRNHTLSIELTLYMRSYCTGNMLSSDTISPRLTRENTNSKRRGIEMLDNVTALPLHHEVSSVS